MKSLSETLDNFILVIQKKVGIGTLKTLEEISFLIVFFGLFLFVGSAGDIEAKISTGLIGMLISLVLIIFGFLLKRSKELRGVENEDNQA